MSRAMLEDALAAAQAQRRAATERLEISEAELVGVEASVTALVAAIRSARGYLAPEHQQAVWDAEAWIAARPRSVPR